MCYSYVVKWLIFLCFIFNSSHAKEVRILNGEWNVTDRVYNVPATVPGGIYTDLMKNNIIGDVFYRINDMETRWVSKKDWTYSRKFTVDAEFLKLTNINLVFDGVDTFSEIYLNGKEIGATDNMFVRYVFDVKTSLKAGENHIEVRFKSAVNKAKELFVIQNKTYPVVPLCVPDEYNGECHVNHVRKVPASFSWDWGPAIPSMGIWKQVYLEGYKDAVIRDVTVKISSEDVNKKWVVKVQTYLEANSNQGSITGDFTLKLYSEDEKPTQCSFKRQTIQKNNNGEFVGLFECKIAKDKIKLWWPNGYGEAKLYQLDVQYASIRSGSGESENRILKIGYRTVKLLQDKISSGLKFYFEVNGVEIFAKGTNSIPINILPELSQNETTIRFLLQSAKDTHMNMIRVWGGGSYEADVFYNIADEMGIMIWQDFMFACAMYPTDDVFLNSVKSEVRHQVRRLQYHPSIVLWAGNNENEAALRQNWYGTARDFTQYHKDYIKLYVEIMKPELMRSDDSRQYLISSPTNGEQSEKEDYVAKDPQSHFYGDVHFYNYNNDSWDSSFYPLTRFASEYGYQSLPRYHTILSATNLESDLQMGSYFLNSRQHLPEGYERLTRLIKYQLHLPEKTSPDYLKTLIYHSQIVQAVAVRKQTEFYRQWRSSLNREGKGFTMGALYWQLNDVWVAPTWSGIDFQNNWKMQHYYAKNFFAPVIVTGDLRPDGFLDIYVVSDLKDDILDGFLNIFVYKWDSISPVHNETLKINVPASRSALVRSFSVTSYFAQIKDDPCGANSLKNCFIYFNLTSSKEESIAPDNYVIPLPINQTLAQNSPPKIEITSIKTIKEETEFEIEITTNRVALFVWLETKPHIRSRFSDNGFVQVTEKKLITVTTDSKPSLESFVDALEVSVLYKGNDNGDGNGGSQKIYCSFWFIIFTILMKLFI